VFMSSHPSPPPHGGRSAKKPAQISSHRVTTSSTPHHHKNSHDGHNNQGKHGKVNFDHQTASSETTEEDSSEDEPKFSSHILTEDEIDQCREAFFIAAKGGETIDVWAISGVFKIMDESLNKNDLMQMISEVMEINENKISDCSPNSNQKVTFDEFLQVVHNYRKRKLSVDDDAEFDMVCAYVACGGPDDTSGHINRETLVKIIKSDFGMCIDLEALIDEVDLDGNGEIEYDEFKALLSQCMAADKL